jgi:hypothetical protein
MERQVKMESMDLRSDFAVEHEVVSMRFARVQFTIRSLMGVVVVTAILVGSAILLLRYSAATRPRLQSPPNGGVIMEGVDINWRPTSERHVLPRELLPPEVHGRR